MTNGEKILNTFPDVTSRIFKDDIGSAYIEVERDDEWVADFDIKWWNSGYKEQTTKNQALDKIRAEITDCLKALDEIEKSGFSIYLPNEMSGRRLTYQQCLEFIDKHKAESEDKGERNVNNV